MTVAEYIAHATTRRWEAGIWDCCCFPAGWVLGWGLGDPMARWRGRYSSDAEALALIDAAGGLEALWLLGMADIGCAPIGGEPQAGDVAVIALPAAYAGDCIGAIFNGKRWAALAHGGVVVARAEALRVWRRP
ncbi:DUF6950 family protein [Sphingomonas baiyangensis]|uniref:DUF6950 domain-containing protein n=1 Tax=Sphingomonas baiyangensis TaxID=2572576 RepID=A0A4U1L0G6_9SPHN|nr:hypothetical protein [Sphingomonas baiyangensis]TKD50227.1 hypothetical protein FBR43_05250 [Sphingomonas baiyangensis]